MYMAQLFLDKQYGITNLLELWPIIPGKLEPYVGQTYFKPYQVVTHLFLHSPQMFLHIVFNMLMLWMFGRVLENVWGPKRFFIFYFACGLGAAALHLGIQYFRAEQLLTAIQAGNQADILALERQISPALGASGAVMGVMVAFAYLFPNTELMILPIPIPIKAKWVVLAYVLLDLFLGIGNMPGDNIAHFAHVGGAVTAFILVYIWNKTNRRTLY
jgi:membrane associated rhomboid family serine protease